jgi:hypothetical protein
MPPGSPGSESQSRDAAAYAYNPGCEKRMRFGRLGDTKVVGLLPDQQPMSVSRTAEGVGVDSDGSVFGPKSARWNPALALYNKMHSPGRKREMALLQQSVACDPGVAKSSGSDAVLQSAIQKAALRLVPPLTIAYLFNYLDRTSLGFAALTMNQQLGLSAGQFGLAAGGLAFINSIGTAGGFVGPSMMGWLREFSGSYVVGLTAVAVILIAATVASMSLKLVGSKE